MNPTWFIGVTIMKQLINNERFTNIQRAQAGLTKLFLNAQKTGSFYRVLKNDRPLGVLIPEDIFQSLTEDLEALSSPSYLKNISRARKEKKRVSALKVKKTIGLE